MTITLVQSKGSADAPASPCTLTPTHPFTASFVEVTVTFQGGGAGPHVSVDDTSHLNTWTYCGGGLNSSDGVGVEKFRCYQMTAGTYQIIVTKTTASALVYAQLAEYSGVLSTGDPAFKTTNSFGNGTPSMSLSPNTPNELVTCAIWIATQPSSAGTNIAWTLVTADNSGGGGYSVIDEYIQTSATPIVGTATISGTGNWAGIMVSYRPAPKPQTDVVFFGNLG